MQARLRIGVDFHTFDGIYQGSRSHLVGLFSEAVRLAPNLDFVFFLHQPDALREYHKSFRLPNVQLVRMSERPGLLRLAFQLPWLMWQHRVDLLHTQYRIPLFGSCACTIHDILFESHPEYFGKLFALQSRASFRYSARRSSLLFTVSEYSKAEIARKYKIPTEKVVVLYNAVDGDRFYPGQDGSESLLKFKLSSGNYLLSVGRLEPRKNHGNLFRAYAALPADVPPLVIVGQKDFGCEGLTQLVDSLGIANRVHFIDTADDRDLPAIMRHARLFIYPSFAEGFGMPVIEAMACGLPVVTSNTTALPEISGDAAEFADPADPRSIAEAINRILSNENWRNDLSARAVEQAARFCWGDSARRLLAAYDQHFARAFPGSVR